MNMAVWSARAQYLKDCVSDKEDDDDDDDWLKRARKDLGESVSVPRNMASKQVERLSISPSTHLSIYTSTSVSVII